MAAYTEQAGLPATPTAIVAALRDQLSATAKAVDVGFPTNEQVTITNGRPVLKRLRAQPDIPGAVALERRLKERLTPIDLIDALADTEQWLNWTRQFGPISGFDAKIDRPQERW